MERQTEQPDLWQDRERAESVLTRLKGLKRRYEPWQKLRAEVTDLAELYELAVAEEAADLESEISATAADLRRTCADLQQLEWMAGPHDAAGCFLTVHAGAGGTEACDWVAMLLRMYTRWAEGHKFKAEIIDLMEVEGGVKSVTAEVAGDYAFGFLRAESGIHRLVRISPFDASKRRHTSFASVAASPVIDDSIEVDTRPEDLRVDTYRASGAGGQHVNKTDSAVRMTHLPTGIVVQCQNERSQHKNRATAMKVLRSRLYDYFEEQQRRERRNLEGDKRDISWGNQIRSYVFQPYTLVKDHRTKFESGNVQAVMDGAIDPFITAYLKHAWGHRAALRRSPTARAVSALPAPPVDCAERSGRRAAHPAAARRCGRGAAGARSRRVCRTAAGRSARRLAGGLYRPARGPPGGGELLPRQRHSASAAGTPGPDSPAPADCRGAARPRSVGAGRRRAHGERAPGGASAAARSAGIEAAPPPVLWTSSSPRCAAGCEELRALSPAELAIAPHKPLAMAAVSGDDPLLAAPRFSSLQAVREADLDLLITGALEEVEGVLFMELHAVDSNLGPPGAQLPRRGAPGGGRRRRRGVAAAARAAPDRRAVGDAHRAADAGAERGVCRRRICRRRRHRGAVPDARARTGSASPPRAMSRWSARWRWPAAG